MTFLLDVNVLVALVDSAHVSHDAAHDWFGREGRKDWATCPITENGLVRILANPKYPNALPTAADAIALARAIGEPAWTRLLDRRCPPSRRKPLRGARMLTAGQITDSYVLALAVSRGASFATLARRLSGRGPQGRTGPRI